MTTKKRRSPRAFGTVRQMPTKSARWQASYIGPDLIRHNAPQTFETRLDAERWLDRQRLAVDDPDWVPPTATSPAAVLTFAAYADAWMSERTVQPNTLIHDQSILTNYLLPTFGKLRLSNITTASVRTWLNGLDRTKPTTNRHALALLRQILANAVDDERIPANPAASRRLVVKRSAVRVDRTPLSAADLATVADAMPERLALLVPLAAYCALRFGEVTALRRSDLDLDTGHVHITHAVTRPRGRGLVDDRPKTESSIRTVAIPPHLLSALRDHCSTMLPTALVFTTPTGEHVPHSTLAADLKRAGATVGRPDLTTHVLRHSGVQLAKSVGASDRDVMGRAGHATLSMSLRYQHTSAERDDEIAVRLSALATE